MATSLEQKALSLLNAFERAGKSVSSVIIEGKRIEIVIQARDDSDEFDRIDMRHGKT
jgi:hypothetical protein